MKLPLLKKLITNFKFNSIIVVVDKLIKDIYFISFIEYVDVDNLLYKFLKWIVSEYSLLKKLISD